MGYLLKAAGRYRISLYFLGALFSANALAGKVEDISAAELILKDASGNRSPALLLDTEIEGSVSGLVATLTLRQKFSNPSDQWVHGDYRFPLPDGAAVDALILKTDGRVIQGVVREKQRAKKIFENAKRSGKKAGLLVQHRPNLFSMSLANIAPGGQVTAEVSWVETVKYAGGKFGLRLPTTLTPRYIPGNPLQSTAAVDDFEADGNLSVNAGNGWSMDTDQVPDASHITPPQIRHPQSFHSHRFSLSLTLNAGIPLSAVTSNSHGILVDGSGDAVQRIRLAGGKALMDRDMILQWVPTASRSPQAAAFRQTGSNENHSLVMLMPPSRDLVPTLPREVIFIIDSSGSMAGISILQAQQGLQSALNLLSPADRFNVIDFDSGARPLFRLPRNASSSNIGTASVFVNNLIADGGTNMTAALDTAFAMPQTEGFLRQIVFMTDGSVGNEQALFEKINQHLGDARLFTVGIGSAPNAHFMRGAARYGRGSYQYIDDVSEASISMQQLFTLLGRPVMKNLNVVFDPATDVVAFPDPLPDLYLGEPAMLAVKSSDALGKLVISGEQAGQRWQRELDISTAPEAKNLDRIWARRKIDQLMSEQTVGRITAQEAKKEITTTGLQYQLATRFTSFVAVEDKPSRPAEQPVTTKTVANLMPSGNTMPLPIPNTATPAALYSVAGTIMLLAGGAILFRRRLTVCGGA